MTEPTDDRGTFITRLGGKGKQADPVPQAVKEPVVTFSGLLGDPDASDVYRLYTSPWLDEWLEIQGDDILYQQYGTTLADGNSIVWVRDKARISKCKCEEACYFAEEALAADADDPGAVKPKHRYP